MGTPAPVSPAPAASAALRGLLVIAGLAGLVVVAALAAMTKWPSQEMFTTVAWAGGEAVVVLGAALASLRWRARRDRAVVIAVGGAVGLASLIWVFGHRQFGAFDFSALIDVGWRLAQGQRLYTDFLVTVPVGFALAAGWAFSWFGVSWSSLVAFQALFTALTFVWAFWLALELCGDQVQAALLSGAIAACTGVVTSYWWYNPPTTVVGCLVVLTAVAWWRRPDSRPLQWSWGASVFLLASMKPNIAGLLLVGVPVVLLRSRALRWRMLGTAAVAAVVMLVALWLAHVEPLGVLRSYLSISGRGLALDRFLLDLTTGEKALALSMFGALVLPLAWGVLRRRLGWLTLLPVVATLAGTVGFLTNGENKLVDLPLLLVSVWLLAEPWGPAQAAGAAERHVHEGLAQRLATAALVVLLGAGLLAGATRVRVRAIGEGFFFDYQDAAASPRTPFLSGMRVGPGFLQLEAELAHAVAEARGRSIFFGNYMQWAYATFRLPSPRGQPAWWHWGISYAPKPEVEHELVQAWLQSPPDVIICLPRNFTLLPEEMLSAIRSNYREVPGYGRIMVLVRK